MTGARCWKSHGSCYHISTTSFQHPHKRIVIVSSILGVGRNGFIQRHTDKQAVTDFRRLRPWSFCHQFASAASHPGSRYCTLGTSQASRISLVPSSTANERNQLCRHPFYGWQSCPVPNAVICKDHHPRSSSFSYTFCFSPISFFSGLKYQISL